MVIPVLPKADKPHIKVLIEDKLNKRQSIKVLMTREIKEACKIIYYFRLRRCQERKRYQRMFPHIKTQVENPIK